MMASNYGSLHSVSGLAVGMGHGMAGDGKGALYGEWHGMAGVAAWHIRVWHGSIGGWREKTCTWECMMAEWQCRG